MAYFVLQPISWINKSVFRSLDGYQRRPNDFNIAGANILMPCLYGKWLEDVCAEYLSVLFCAVLWAAAPGLVAVLPMWDSAYVSGTVTSQAIGFPLGGAGPWQESGPSSENCLNHSILVKLLTFVDFCVSLCFSIWLTFAMHLWPRCS